MNSERQSHYLLKNMRRVGPPNINPPITANKYFTRGVGPPNINPHLNMHKYITYEGSWTAQHQPSLIHADTNFNPSFVNTLSAKKIIITQAKYTSFLLWLHAVDNQHARCP